MTICLKVPFHLGADGLQTQHQAKTRINQELHKVLFELGESVLKQSPVDPALHRDSCRIGLPTPRARVYTRVHRISGASKRGN